MKFIAPRLRVAFHIVLLVQLAANANALSGAPAVRSSPSLAAELSPKEAERVIAGRARQVILALKAGDMAKFSTFVHPQKGVRFSPYADVTDDNRIIKRTQLASLWASSKRYKWGSYDAVGGPINLSFRKYYRRFVFDHDYSRAPHVSYNPANMSHGTTPNNIRTVFPESIAVEYHFTGFNPKYDGMDWKSLWLVFEKRGAGWYVVGIVHDEWTT